METDGQDKAAEIKNKVAIWIDGKHSRIGVILPEHDPNPDDLSEIYRTLAGVAVSRAKREAARE